MTIEELIKLEPYLSCYEEGYEQGKRDAEEEWKSLPNEYADRLAEISYQRGRADGYHKAENDYFANSQKDRDDAYNCGYEVGKADAIPEGMMLVKKDDFTEDLLNRGYSKGRADAIDGAIQYFEEHAHEVYDHVSARDFICDVLEQMKGEADVR